MSTKPALKKSFGGKMLKSISKLFNEPGYLRRKVLRQKSKQEFVATEDNRSESENGLYIGAVKEAARNYAAFSKFKRNPHYRAILEHVSPEQGREYLEIIRQQSPEFVSNIDRFKINDMVGGPLVYEYPDIGTISPTTLRYIKVASDLQKHFGDLMGGKIVEVGVGYGGQCLVYDRIGSFKEYHLYDLPPVLDLVAQYLECHLLRSSYRTSTLNRNNGDETYDLAISNYAFSELPSQVQAKYVEKIFSRSKRGYLTMNSGMENSCFTKNKLSLDELRRLLPAFEVVEEKPLTFLNNYIIIWGHY
jgi:putative sugar O-methyltransferase